MLAEVLNGLRQTQKSISSKYLYDERGSQLFEQICRLDEYYPTRTETALLEAYAAEIAGLVGPAIEVLEPGSGASDKIRILLRHLLDPVAYVPFEISEEILASSAASLAQDFPGLEVLPVIGDFTGGIEVPRPKREAARKLLFFPGSTIGNFRPDEAREFLVAARRLLGPGGMMLIGADRKKDATILERAYDDAAGVTAEFNLNLLDRLSRELGAGFDRAKFRHRARYDEAAGRIEMHLESLVEQQVAVGGERFTFARGETILTEVSHKYHPEEFADLARSAGLEVAGHWTDAENLFALYLLR